MTRWIKRAVWLSLAVLLVVLAGSWIALRGSLPQLDGQPALADLSAPATISRDALGVVTVDAATAADMARALGYVHAQERYFEMDLMRRTSAGELAELFGPLAVDSDRSHRLHRMRARVARQLHDLDGEQRAQLQAYADGVNAGQAALKVRPWPYLLLQQTPRPWTPADSLLAGYAMYFDLQDADNARELALWKLRPHLPAALFALLTHDGSSWDAPLLGPARGDAVLPGADAVDLRRLPMPAKDKPVALAGLLALTPPSAPRTLPLSPAARERGVGGPPAAVEHAPGSNNFAVAGRLTGDGRAIVADDMHLSLRAPNIWFRARLRYADARAPGGRVDVSGFTLPGLPAVIVGSNGHIAWGFTNAYADTADWYRVHPCGDAAGKTESCERLTRHAETIRVAGAAPQTLLVWESAYGPILHTQADGAALALRWAAHLPGSLNLGLAGFAHARGLDDALRIAEQTAMPAQNLVLGDASGHITWRVLGALPQRGPQCAPATVQEAGRCPPWPIATADARPQAEPIDGRLWTANNRLADGPALALLGDAGYAAGARAAQIRDDLRLHERFDEKQLLAIQLDDRALYLQRWWALLQHQAQTKADSGQTPALAQLARAAQHWEGNADAGSVSYRIVRAWRLAVHTRIVDGLTAPAQAVLGRDFALPNLTQIEGVVWPLLQQRPDNLLPRRYSCESRGEARASPCTDSAGWDALLEDAAREVRDDLSAHGPLQQRSWGERNTAKICHPLSRALPGMLESVLCMPADPLPGDTAMPRVQGPSFGASQRMVVSPGHEADGIVHMPGGQSGHPLSPYWGAGHDDWVHGRPTPFLPGAAQHTLTLRPR